MAGLVGIPLEQALLEYTNLTVRFGLGRHCGPEDEVWRAYLEGARGAHDLLDWTERFYHERRALPWPSRVVAVFGCFSYAQHGDTDIKLHFRDAEPSDRSPLDLQRAPARRADLAALFAHVRESQGSDFSVHGASWLYNLDAYCRLFPKAYVETTRASGGQFRRMPLWGQFLDRHGETRPQMTEPFLARLAACRDPAALDGCFPFPVRVASAPGRVFFEEYGLSAATPG